MQDLIQLAANGLGWHDAGLTLIRASVGTFFAISGYHKLFNAERHAKLTNTLKNDNVPFLPFMQWWVPGWEFVAGVSLTVGLLSAFSAVVLTIICIVACCCESKARVAAYHPIDLADTLDDWFYLPEVLYLVMLAVTIFSGPGKYSLDHVFF